MEVVVEDGEARKGMAGNSNFSPLRTGDSLVDRNLDLIKSSITSLQRTASGIPPLQIAIGPVQSLNGTTTSATYVPPSNTLNLTFIAQETSLYRVFTTGFQMFNSSAGQSISARLVPLSGSPGSIGLLGQVSVDTTAGFGTALNFTYTIDSYYNLTKDTQYVFQLQAQTSGGTLTFAFSTLHAALMAQQLQ